MPDLSDFDRYCDEHHILPEDAPVAFAAWLEEVTGAPVTMEQVGGPVTTLYPPEDPHA
jgi:hypothetical protein